MSKARCVVVTGAESGIGAACAAAFGAAGDDVAVFYYRDEDKARTTVEAVTAAGGRAKAVQCAVDDEQSVEAAFAAVEEAFGPAAVAVNSAGVNMAGIPVREMTADRWRAMIATDLTGAFLVSRRFLKRRGDSTDPAALIHISSIHAEVVRAGGADYCAAKGGLTKLVQTLAIEEAARGIRVNAIRPGMILTPMNQRALDDDSYRASLEKNIPMQRAGRPEEVAAMARWLASDEAAYVTGASFTIDGGLSLLLGQGA
ncbi:MAG TPA: SDR family oxidoreductase [Sphingomonas sp.]|nr:SDR family oxidoreductase [Sphingomonas sp.]